jgi:Zn-finger nucleic acid-binding protein
VMEFVVGEGIGVDRCPQCSGVFLGKKQLEALRHASHASGYWQASILHTVLGLV